MTHKHDYTTSLKSFCGKDSKEIELPYQYALNTGEFRFTCGCYGINHYTSDYHCQQYIGTTCYLCDSHQLEWLRSQLQQTYENHTNYLQTYGQTVKNLTQSIEELEKVIGKSDRK